MSYKSNGKTYDKSKYASFVGIVSHLKDDLAIIYVDNLKKFIEASINYHNKDMGLMTSIGTVSIFDIPIAQSGLLHQSEYMAVRNNNKVVMGYYC